MKRIRLLLAGITALLLTAGYLASQQAYLAGQWGEYAQRVDRPEIVYLSLLLFVLAVAFLFIRDPEEPEA